MCKIDYTTFSVLRMLCAKEKSSSFLAFCQKCVTKNKKDALCVIHSVLLAACDALLAYHVYVFDRAATRSRNEVLPCLQLRCSTSALFFHVLYMLHAFFGAVKLEESYESDEMFCPFSSFVHKISERNE